MATKICPVCKSEYEGGEVFCPLDGARVVTHTQMESGDIPDDPLIGQMLDKYKVIRQIGEGGMGLVYEGIHTVIEKRVAIKLLRDDFSSRPEVVARAARRPVPDQLGDVRAGRFFAATTSLDGRLR